MKKMIIDCDTGIDDALAIAYILSNPDIDLLGITTTYGNVSVDVAAKNSLLLLDMFNRDDVDVYKGAAHSYDEKEYIRNPKLDFIHGKNGIGDVELGEPKRSVSDRDAVDFIIDNAKKYNEDLHLVLVGPLTNFANCIKKDLEAIKSIGDITIMGGALTIQGNRNVYAEANVSDDPKATRFVFESDIHINIVPLDATLKTLFKVGDIDEWKNMNKVGKDLYDIARFYYVNEYRSEDVGGAMHDPLAVFASLDPSIITNWFDCNLTCEDNGRTIATFKELNLDKKRHSVALDVDANRFLKEYIEIVTNKIKSLD